MPDRLSTLDASFRYVEDPATPMHVGEVAVFDRPRAGFDHEAVLALVSQRFPFLSCYQGVLEVSGWLARPVWVDDVDFGVNLLITHSPGPQVPLYAGQARMVPVFRVMPLVRDQALAIGVTSYHDGVCFGLDGDRKALSDVHILAGTIEEALDERKGAHW